MINWLFFHWFDLIFGLSIALLCSFVRSIVQRFLLSTVLVLCFYWALVTVVAHAGAKWNNEAAAAMILGTAVGCLVRPVVVLLVRAAKGLLSS